MDLIKHKKQSILAASIFPTILFIFLERELTSLNMLI